MLSHIISDVVDTIEQQKPKSLIYCTEEMIPALEELRNEGCVVSHTRDLEALNVLPRFDLGIVFDFLEQRSIEEGTQLLCRLRNFNCEKIWVAVMTSHDWNLNVMISLGFKRENSFNENGREICTYSYDIATYNKKREWNNPRFWANPENWGKYRW